MKLIPNSPGYWQFIRELRFHPENVHGFLDTNPVTPEQQDRYMARHGHSYFICLEDDGTPVGFIGAVDGDLRLAVHPGHKRRGVARFMIGEFLQTHPDVAVKVLPGNTASLQTFLACGFEVTGFHGQCHRLTRRVP